MNKKATSSIFGICFVVLLGLVFVINIIVPDKGFSEEENRVLQKNPDFSLSSYMEGRYEKKLETYTNDQFLLRNTFIKIKAAADITSGKLESNGVYKGRDNYLIEDLTVPKKETMDNTLAAMKKFKKRYGRLDMYFLLAPNAGNILEDKLPTFVQLADQNKYMDRFFKDIKAIGYKPIDTRKALSKAAAAPKGYGLRKQEDTQIYYRTDHHWTTDGAFIAYKEASKKMKLKDNVSYQRYIVKNDFRGTLASKSGFVNGENDSITLYMPKDNEHDFNNSVIYYTDTKEKTTEFYKLDNLNTKDAYTVFGGSNHPIYTIKTPVKSERRLLLVKDSYANSFIPFLSQNYREIVVVDPRYFFDNINDIISTEDITEVLFLYNANTFFADNSLQMMLTS